MMIETNIEPDSFYDNNKKNTLAEPITSFMNNQELLKANEHLSDSTRSSSLQTNSAFDSDNAVMNKECLSHQSENYDEDRENTSCNSKTMSDAKKQKKLTLKELQKKKKRFKQFTAFEIEESKKSKEFLDQNPKINFEKCLNLFSNNKNDPGNGKGKGTKPMNPKVSTVSSPGFSFGNPYIVQNQDDPATHFTQSQKYKTEICKNFEMKGKCKWGENCCFAHGKNELRKKTLFNYFYKTKICKHFHKNGFCPYASRCQYFHFKKYQIYQELFESFSNKIYSRLEENTHECIPSILERTERVTRRLSIFSKLSKIKITEKSLYEKFDLDHF